MTLSPAAALIVVFSVLFLGLIIIVGICMLVQSLRGPFTADREGIRDAPTVVAGPDLEWQLNLARIYRDYDAYRLQHRLPGEGR